MDLVLIEEVHGLPAESFVVSAPSALRIRTGDKEQTPLENTKAAKQARGKMVKRAPGFRGPDGRLRRDRPGGKAVTKMGPWA